MDDMLKKDAVSYLKGDSVTQFNSKLRKLLTNELQSPDNDSFEDDYTELLKAAKQLKGVAVPYAQIAQMIFKTQSENLKTNDGIGPVLDRFKQRLLTSLEALNTDKVTDELTILLKTYQNMSLSDAQYQSLLGQDNVEALNSDIQTLKNNLESSTNEFDKKVDERMNSVYSGFVSVLGIFIAITFTLFGGMNLLSKIFSNIAKGATHVDTGLTIMLSGIFAILIYLIILGLTSGLSRLTQQRSYFYKEDFSFRTLFIIITINVGIAIFGFTYSRGPFFWDVPFLGGYQFEWTALNISILYTMMVLLLYRNGRILKKWIVNPRINGTKNLKDVIEKIIFLLLFILIFILIFK